MNIYLTGDLHGDFKRLFDFSEKLHTTREDIVIALGDVGLNFYLDERDAMRKQKLQELPLTFFCIHGNHEERPENIPTYREKQWHGGTVFYEEAYPNLLFAKDGEIYDLAGKKAIVIGGAYSVDKVPRLIAGWPWFASEQPSAETKRRVEEKLKQAGWKIDIVLTHTGPYKYLPVETFLPFIDQESVDQETERWLDMIEDRLEYAHWYFAHYHLEKAIDKIRILYEEIWMLS